MKSKSGVRDLLKLVKKGIVNNTAEYLPISVINSIILKNINLVDSYVEDMTFEIAQTEKDLEQAFHLLYKAYVAEGFMDENEFELRVTPYHALPTTCTIVAKIKDEVIATVSIVKSSNFGIPLESAICIDGIKDKAHQNVAEISALAVKKEYRKESGKVLFPIMKYLYFYSRDYINIDYMLIAVHPTSFTFYEALFGFKKLEAEVIEEYSFVNNAAMQAGYMDMKEAETYIISNFINQPPESNLFQYMLRFEDKRFNFPDREIKKAFDSVMNNDLFIKFFIERSDAINDFSPRQMTILLDIFKDLKDQLPPEVLSQLVLDHGHHFFSRRSYRCSVYFACRLYYSEEDYIETTIIEASYGGFGVVLNKAPELNESYAFKIKVGDYNIVELEAENVSDLKCGIYGFKINRFNRLWYANIKEILEGIDCKISA